MDIEELVTEIRRIKNISLFEQRIKDALILKHIQKWAFHNLLTFDDAVKKIEKYITDDNKNS